MPYLVAVPQVVPVPGGKVIEVTLVLTGSVLVEHDGGTTVVGEGQALLTRAGMTAWAGMTAGRE